MNQINQNDDFVVTLQNEFSRRIARNPRYSLRSFSRDLEIGSSELSRIFSRKRPLTPKLVRRFGTRFQINPQALAHFEQAAARKKKGASTLPTESPRYERLTFDVFYALSEWYHFALIELKKTSAWNNDTKKIAAQLGITVTEVNVALDRLVRLGLFRRLSSGDYEVMTSDTSHLNEKETHSARQRFQQSLLEKAMDAIFTVPFSHRDQSSIIMAIDSKRLPEAREVIKRFRRRLNQLLEKEGSCDSVYVLNVSLFPVSEVNHAN